jgi:hypothetical protein
MCLLQTWSEAGRMGNIGTNLITWALVSFEAYDGRTHICVLWRLPLLSLLVQLSLR